MTIERLRKHLAEGAEEARAGIFVEDYSVERLIAELNAEGAEEVPSTEAPSSNAGSKSGFNR